jgi:protein involved in polysaccharide export with SLBB domain
MIGRLTVCGLLLLQWTLPLWGESGTLSDRKLGVGDRVRYRVVEDQEPVSEIVVGNTGALEVPFHGPVQAVGKTPAQLKGEIKEALEKELYISATVILNVIEYRLGTLNRGRVHLSGQVKSVGAVEIDLDLKNMLGRVLLTAGGLTDFADKKSVRIIRQNSDGDNITITVDLREVLDKGNLDSDVELRDGDFVIVNEKLINW